MAKKRLANQVTLKSEPRPNVLTGPRHISTFWTYEETTGLAAKVESQLYNRLSLNLDWK